MFRHRLAPEADHYRLPEPPAPKFREQDFVLCSIAVTAGCTAVHWAGVHQLYVVALELAQASVRPSVLERDLLAFWN